MLFVSYCTFGMDYSRCFRVHEVGKELFDMLLWKLETSDLEYFRAYQYIVLLFKGLIIFYCSF